MNCGIYEICQSSCQNHLLFSTARLVLRARTTVIPCLKAFAKVELGGNILELHPLESKYLYICYHSINPLFTKGEVTF